MPQKVKSSKSGQTGNKMSKKEFKVNIMLNRDMILFEQGEYDSSISKTFEGSNSKELLKLAADYIIENHIVSPRYRSFFHLMCKSNDKNSGWFPYSEPGYRPWCNGGYNGLWAFDTSMMDELFTEMGYDTDKNGELEMQFGE